MIHHMIIFSKGAKGKFLFSPPLDIIFLIRDSLVNTYVTQCRVYKYFQKSYPR